MECSLITEENLKDYAAAVTNAAYPFYELLNTLCDFLAPFFFD